VDGSEKMPLLVIGKYEKPKCFKHAKSLPYIYRRNNSAQITCTQFMEFLTCLERRMGKYCCFQTSVHHHFLNGIPDIPES
jgi:hypothetical protein